jgi:FlaA1/EpsC-like NDP-sugar epimerase
LNSQARDAILYFVIALAIVGAALVIGIYDADHGLSSDRQMQWIAAGIFTCLIFGLVIKTNHKLWRLNKFLALLLALLLVHTLIIIWIVRVALANSPTRIPLVLYMFISILEVGVFNYICARLFKRRASMEGHLRSNHNA